MDQNEIEKTVGEGIDLSKAMVTMAGKRGLGTSAIMVGSLNNLAGDLATNGAMTLLMGASPKEAEEEMFQSLLSMIATLQKQSLHKLRMLIQDGGMDEFREKFEKEMRDAQGDEDDISGE